MNAFVKNMLVVIAALIVYELAVKKAIAGLGI